MKKVALSPVCVLSTFAKSQLALRHDDAHHPREVEAGEGEG